MKQYLVRLPTLARPIMREALWMYLAVSKGAVSSILLRQKGSQQQLIYYTIHILKRGELHYSKLENLAYALVLMARRL